jgi:hypothetical protein
MEKSWTFKELHQTRNFKNSFHNIFSGLMYSGFFKVFGGVEPFDIRNDKKDSQNWVKPASEFEVTYYLLSQSSIQSMIKN